MTSYNVKLKKVADYDTQVKEVRNQLNEQLRVFDSHLEQKTQLLQDLSEYLRRRGEIEGEYARSLEKLADKFASRTKKKELSCESVLKCWQELLIQTRHESKDHTTLSESCGTTLPQQLSRCLELVQRLAKKSKETGNQLQEGFLKTTAELQSSLKTYSQYHTEYLSAEVKLKEATKQEEKQKQSASKKMERLIEKRQCKVQETQQKCNKARNDYLFNLEAANSSMHKYYLQDLSALIDFSDLGFHQSWNQVLQFYLSSRTQVHQNLGSGLHQLGNALCGLDQNQDRDTLIQAHEVAFCMPLRFQYQPHEGDQVCEVSADSEVKSELDTRFHQLQTRLNTVTAENQELSKMLCLSHSALLECISEDIFQSEHSASQSLENLFETSTNKLNQARRRSNLQESENSYSTKFKDHLINGLLILKLQAKHDLLKVAIQKAGTVDGHHHSRMRSRRSVRQRKNQHGTQITEKAFSQDMLSYIQASGEPIPLVVESCIRFINLHGLHHEGIFRISGSQLEVNRLRDLFEKGDDPLAEENFDLDSVAGVLKLYFRGMDNPLFPKDSFDQLMECGRLEDDSVKVAQLKSVILSYPSPVIVVMRYLFAFLHHVSQYSDENMMQPYNLAVCFGPSLIRGPEDTDPVTLQQINALIKTIIIHHESIFPSQNELEGSIYETCMTLEPDDIEAIAEESEMEPDMSPNKEAKDELEGVALFDYTARSTAELSFKQGRRVRLYSRASSDWWRGEVDGSKGLIPNKYISVPSMEGWQEHNERHNSGSQAEEQQAGITQTRIKVLSEKSGLSSSQALAGKISLQLPVVQLPSTSPRALRKSDLPMRRVPPDIERDEVKVVLDKDVCQNMDSVFKELLIRQQHKDHISSSSVPSHSSASQQNLNKKGLAPQKGKGSIKTAEQMN
ncbi:rho GTPase-activating protein 4a isoform X1 [Silurus meridionalis]|nr:rho GTPase-activating protein 4a isoform X1 [Silurus meridionalis]XP_046725896.1 rho GTPase-activating protein 4a isoform X1 [Silurus meridionalis]